MDVIPNSSKNSSEDIIRKMYITMLKIRRFEEKVADLVQKKEIITPCHLYIGQEAVATGVCLALKKGDYVFSTHRSHGHYIAKGGNIKTLMAELYGRAVGCSKGRGGSMHIASEDIGLPGSSAIVAGTIPLAVGSALAFSLNNIKKVSVAFFGDGATNEGAFYESLNFASLKNLPVIFICENNLFSTHMHIASCLSNPNISEKAKMFNIPGVRVDGNNVLRVYEISKDLIEAAREGKGPSLIECLTYRWRGHVGPNFDLDKGLRSKKELDYWINRCPIKSLERYLLINKKLSAFEINEILLIIDKEIEDALNFSKNSPFPRENDLFKYVFKNKVVSYEKDKICSINK